MPIAEIITIGTEILLGEIVDTNARYIARVLRDLGINLYRKTTIGDNANRIAKAIHTAIEESEIIITTGGLGPTIDDATREGIALAIGVQLEYHAELWEQILERFRRFDRKPTDNNKRQAYIPQGAIPIENPVGTAPAFISETEKNAIIALPGVPREMEYLMKHQVQPYLRKCYYLKEIIKTRIIRTAGAGESQIDDLIQDLETLINPTVGLSAHSGQVDVRITAKANSEIESINLIQPIEDEVRERLGKWVYGVDQDTLEEVALDNLAQKGWRLIAVEAGLGGHLISRLAEIKNIFLGGEVLAITPSIEGLINSTDTYRLAQHAEAGLGLAIHNGEEKQEIHIVIITPEGKRQITRTYGGPPDYAPRWALNLGLDAIRNL